MYSISSVDCFDSENGSSSDAASTGTEFSTANVSHCTDAAEIIAVNMSESTLFFIFFMVSTLSPHYFSFVRCFTLSGMLLLFCNCTLDR